MGMVLVMFGGGGLGCAAQQPTSRLALPAPIESTAVGPGDLLTVEIVGEKDLPIEYEVQADGSLALPYVQPLVVEGLEPHQVAVRYHDALTRGGIWDDPQVMVRVKLYRSKRIVVSGEVKAPASFPFVEGMTLVQAVSQAGGVNAIANVSRVRLTRTLADGSTRSADLDLEAISAGLVADVPLQAGDRIYVIARVF